jgi:hypothetical protein
MGYCSRPNEVHPSELSGISTAKMIQKLRDFQLATASSGKESATLIVSMDTRVTLLTRSTT